MRKKKNATLDDLAWQWTEKPKSTISENNVKSSYRLLLPKCKNCKKNTAGNPNCLHALGESFWIKSKVSNEDYLEKIQNQLNEERRSEGELVGLRNLGATCYVNTYLQLWFHNLKFRKSIYELEEQDESTNGDMPQTICGQLQLMFGLLQSGFAKSVDPASFINCLNLPVDLQQDAHEFSKLFMSLLETTPGLSKVIQSQFSGRNKYVTKCLKCFSVVETPSMFYELDLNIQGHKDLRSCIKKYLTPEALENDNQYFCDKCQSKQDATRQIVLKELPNTLSIQLLRFVYDRASQQKHKINTNLSFPDKLDFSDFVSSDNEKNFSNLEYHLTAVLLHRGPSAYSGHFVAHILDQETNTWYRFNDELVEKIKHGKKIDLDSTSTSHENPFGDIFKEPSPKRGKLSKGNYSSKDVYMLVYSTKFNASKEDIKIPDHISSYVEKQNMDFEVTLYNNLEKAKLEQEQKLKQEADMNEFLQILSSTSDQHEWIPTTFLKNFLQNGKLNVVEVHNNWSRYVCLHNNLSLHAIGVLKYIPKAAADYIYASNSEASRLNVSICYHCVSNQFQLILEKKKLKNDCMLISKALKSYENNEMAENEACFYVGRLSMRKWKHFVMQNIRKSYPTKLSVQPEENCDSSQSDVEEQFVFNSDLLCAHQQLSTKLDNVHIVPQLVWDILLQYFPNTIPYKIGECISCTKCTDEIEKSNIASKILKSKAIEQKSRLYQLYLNKNRPPIFFGDLVHDDKCANERYYVVNSEFVEKWRQFVRNPLKHDEMFLIENKPFLCPHMLLMYDLPSYLRVNFGRLNDDESNIQPNCTLLWENEWEYIASKYTVDFTIWIQKLVVSPCSVILNKIDSEPNSEATGLNKDGGSSPKPSVIIHSEVSDYNSNNVAVGNIKICVNPEICFECVRKQVVKAQEKLHEYENADIYVFKSSKTVVEMLESSSEDPTDLQRDSSLSPQSVCRRNTRTRKCARGAKKLSNISSKITLKQLKVKIMSLFSVPPFDQNIWLSGKFLTDNNATLGNLNISPDCTLTLVEDTPDPNAVPLVFEVSAPEPEVGFLGTSLLGNLGL